jgi:hypothetical protein
MLTALLLPPTAAAAAAAATTTTAAATAALPHKTRHFTSTPPLHRCAAFIFSTPTSPFQHQLQLELQNIELQPFSQVAEVCANDPTWKAVCSSIPCPPITDQCVPGPYVAHPVLPDACFVYDYHSPLQSSAAAAGMAVGAAAAAAVAMAAMLWV